MKINLPLGNSWNFLLAINVFFFYNIQLKISLKGIVREGNCCEAEEKINDNLVVQVLSENASYRRLQNQSVLIKRRIKWETTNGYIKTSMLADWEAQVSVAIDSFRRVSDWMSETYLEMTQK